MVFIFEDYTIEPDKHTISKDGVEQDIEPRVFELICLLITHRTRLITKDEIYEKIWNNRFISESSISTSINLARKALGDTGKQQKTIKTIHNKGYRFVGHVTESVRGASDENPHIQDNPAPASKPAPPALNKQPSAKSSYLLIASSLLIGGFVTLIMFRSFLTPQVDLAGDNHITIGDYKAGDMIDGSTGTDLIDFSEETQGGYVIHIFDGMIYKKSDTNTENAITILNVENIRGTDFDDDLNGGVEANTIHGGPGHDIINGNGAIDMIYGGPGNDTINGGYRLDRIFGEEGDDHFIVSTISAGDVIDGGPGNDTIDYSTFTHSGIIIDLEAQLISERLKRENGPYKITNVENIIGTELDDVLIGDPADNIIQGHAGNNKIDGRSGYDIVKYANKASDYIVTKRDENTWEVEHITQTPSDIQTHVDQLTNIESIQFEDQMTNLAL